MLLKDRDVLIAGAVVGLGRAGRVGEGGGLVGAGHACGWYVSCGVMVETSRMVDEMEAHLLA